MQKPNAIGTSGRVSGDDPGQETTSCSSSLTCSSLMVMF